MQRQFLCFLHGGDEAALLARIDAVEPGLVVVPGRYVATTDPAALLANPAALEVRQALRSERRIYLAHRTHSRSVLLVPQPGGPRAGLCAIDELRSEVLALSLPRPHALRLRPARLACDLVWFEGYERRRKGHGFGRWAARVLRALEAAYPRTSVELVHLAGGALGFAAAGGQLTYLEEPVLPGAAPGRRQPCKQRIEGPHDRQEHGSGVVA